MKKFYLLCISLVMALIIIEIIIRFCIGYPTLINRTKYFFLPNEANYSEMKWRDPYYTFLNVENGIRYVKYNNLGLPGLDVKTGANCENLFLLGSSFIEASQVSTASMASSVLQNNMQKFINPNIQVFNLGLSAYDPYLSFFRAVFFEQYFPPTLVVLIVEREANLLEFFNRHKKPLNFSIPHNFGIKKDDSKFLKLSGKIFSFSATANLLRHGIEASNHLQEQNECINKTDLGDINELLVPLLDCLQSFQNRYEEKFIVFSLLENTDLIKKITQHCKEKRISFFDLSIHNILRKENRINGIGHLNNNGNSELGLSLFRVISKVFKNNKMQKVF